MSTLIGIIILLILFVIISNTDGIVETLYFISIFLLIIAIVKFLF